MISTNQPARLSQVLKQHSHNRENISKSLLAMKHNQKRQEGTIIQRQKQKIASIVRVISCRSMHQRHLLHKLGRSLEKEEKLPCLDSSSQQTPGLYRVFNCKINAGWKPSHRYSSNVANVETTMVEYSNRIYLYGGLGCQRLLNWACFDLATCKWRTLELQDTIANIQHRPRFARYSHSTIQYKNKAIIYGGFTGEICGDLTLFDFDKLEYDVGSRGPGRRDHAAAVMGKFMIVHGGISQENSQVSDEFHLYNIDQDVWCEMRVYGDRPPGLSHHKIAATIRKYRRPSKYSDNTMPEELYMFGGKLQEGASTNELYRMKLQANATIRVQKIEAKKAPLPRYEHCMEFIQTGYLLVHGGRSHQESTGKRCYQGVFHDIHLFDIAKECWWQPIVSGFPASIRYGMASAAIGTSVIVFGGCDANHFHDGDLYEIETDSSKIPRLQDFVSSQSDKSEFPRRPSKQRYSISRLNTNKLIGQ